MLNLGFWIPSLFDSDRQWTDTSELILSACLVLYSLLFYVSVKIVTPKLKEKLSKEYPEYKIL